MSVRNIKGKAEITVSDTGREFLLKTYPLYLIAFTKLINQGVRIEQALV